MERYVIRDTYYMKFVSSINLNGVETDSKLEKAIILENLNKAKRLLEYLNFDSDDYVIEEIQFKVIEMEE